MKKYTLIQAIKEIERTIGFFGNTLTSIMYEDGSRNKFIVDLEDGKKYFINLDEYTYKLIN